MMCGIPAIILLTFGMHTMGKELAKEAAASGSTHSQDFTGKLVHQVVDQLMEKAVRGPSILRTNLDDATLGKHGQLAAPQHSSVRSAFQLHAHHGYTPRSCLPVGQFLVRPGERASIMRAVDQASVDAAVADPRKTGMALMLDDGTRKSHSMAENGAFVTGFFRGICEKKQFAQLVADLYFVYSAMENAFDATQDADVRTLDLPQLRRVPQLEKDMEFYFGSDWRTTVQPSKATAKYVAQVEKVAKEQPELLIAHQYTRYLGDLFGGQMMSGMATKSLGLPEGKGVAFYQFKEIPDIKEFINEWYSNLNGLKLTESQKIAIVDEANLVFALNIELFGELEGNALVPMVRLALDALKEKIGLK